MDTIINNLSADQAILNSRIFDLVLGRVLKNIYLNLNDTEKKEMEIIFSSGSSEEKTKFVKKYKKSLKTIFKQEAEKISEEIKMEIENQI